MGAVSRGYTGDNTRVDYLLAAPRGRRVGSTQFVGLAPKCRASTTYDNRGVRKGGVRLAV